MILLALVVAPVFLLLLLRFRTRFLRAYGLAALILLVYASNKDAFGIPPELHEATFSPLSSTRWLSLGLLALMAFALPVPPWFRFKRSFIVPLLMLVVWMLFSSTYSSTFLYSLMRACSFGLLAVAMLRGLGIFLTSRGNALNLFELIFDISAVALVPFLAIRYFAPDLFPVDDVYGHYVGMFSNPNTLGGYAALVTPFAIFRWKNGKTQPARMAGLMVLGVVLFSVVVSRSRGATIACVLAVAAYMFTVDPRERLRVIAGVVVIVAGMAVFPNLSEESQNFLTRGGEVHQVQEEKRFEIWQGVFPIFWEQKWTGMGFAASHQEVFNFTLDEQPGRSVHNSYLELFGDLGIPGILLLAIVFVRAGQNIAVLLRRVQPYLDRSISAVFVSCFIAGAANAFVESWLFSVGSVMALIFWTAVGGMIGRAVLLDRPVAPETQLSLNVAPIGPFTPTSNPA